MNPSLPRSIAGLAVAVGMAFTAACGKKEQAQATAAPAAAPVAAPAKVESYRIAWSHYTGWEPWGYMADAGILKKWADKYGIAIDVTLVNDYVESINLYTAGKFDGCVMTNMDALTIPAVGGVDSTALIIGDYSNGNDGIVIKNGSDVKALKGRPVNLVELSVSHYLLARALDKNGMSEKDVSVINTSDADIAAAFTNDANGAAVTWNPPLQQALKAPGAKLVFDSSQIPGEIMDLMVVKTGAPDSLKKALTGAWYEMLALMNSDTPEGAKAIEAMAQASGATVDEFKAQLQTTAMFYEPAKAVEFAATIAPIMEAVRSFAFAKGLYGEGAQSADLVGIELVDGKVLGDPNNVKLRFTDQYMRMAAEGKL